MLWMAEINQMLWIVMFVPRDFSASDSSPSKIAAVGDCNEKDDAGTIGGSSGGYVLGDDTAVVDRDSGGIERWRNGTGMADRAVRRS